MAIVGIGRDGPAKRRDGIAMQIEPLLELAKRKPGGGKAGSQLHGLHHDPGSAFKIAAQLQIASKVVAPVRHQIAGGHEQTRRHDVHIRMNEAELNRTDRLHRTPKANAGVERLPSSHSV